MPDNIPQNETRTRILEIAERLFSERGYTSVRLRDIADEVGMKHASLYYYAPGGKEGLYMEVMERSFKRHHTAMTQAIAEAGDNVRQQLYAVADWMLSQPPMDLTRMTNADANELSAANAERLMETAYNAMRGPLSKALAAAAQAGQVTVKDTDLAAITLVSLIQAGHTIPARYAAQRTQIVHDMIDMMLEGILAD